MLPGAPAPSPRDLPSIPAGTKRGSEYAKSPVANTGSAPSSAGTRGPAATQRPDGTEQQTVTSAVGRAARSRARP